MKRLIKGLLISLLIISFAGTAAAVSHTLVVAGTGDSQVVLRQLAIQYECLYPDTRILVPDSVGSGGGIKAILAGTAGLARTARPLKDGERDAGLVQLAFAKSPVVFAAHPSVAKVEGLTLTQAVRIFNGDIVNWRALGGPDHKLYVVNREQGDSSRKVISAYISELSGSDMVLGNAGKIAFTTPSAVEIISWNDYTVGFVPFASAKAAKLHVFSIAGVLPTEKTVGDGTYPLVTTFYLVYSPGVSAVGKAFLSFVKTREAKQLMLTSGVFPADR